MNMICLNGNYSAGNRHVLNPKLPEIRYHSKEFGSGVPVAGMIPGHKLELKKIEFGNSWGKKKSITLHLAQLL